MSRTRPRCQLRRAVQARLGDSDQGSALVWLLLMLPVLFLFAGLVLDGGRVITSRQNAANVAEQAARRGADQVAFGSVRQGSINVIDLAAAQTAACSYTATVAANSTCSASLTLSGQVRVNVTITTPTALLAAVGVPQITVTGTGQSRPAVGVTQEVAP